MGLSIIFLKTDEQGNPIKDKWGYNEEIEADDIFNVTHNLTKMASEGPHPIYQALWRPEEIGYTHANQLATAIRLYLQDFIANAAFYRKFNPENGWGSYEGFREFLLCVLDMCDKYPNAPYEVSV